jgi:aryl-alcohol dehydrogenase-like predicted oxidoreductase
MWMEQRRLGKQGPELTSIGFGCWAMGGVGRGDVGGWGPQDEGDAITAIQFALDAGVNWFDTAAVYGLGHSEEVLGRALGNRRKDIVVATKFGLVWDDQGHLTNKATYDSVKQECDASLRRLGTDYIDLYQQHWPDAIGTPVEETMRALDDLIKGGKVRYAGVSNFDGPLLERALTVRHVDSLQPPYSLFHREVEAEILPFCRSHGIGVVAYSPLASGLLGGRYTTDQTFDQSDWRSSSPDFTGEGLERNLEKVERLREIANRFGRTVPQLAIAWVLSNPAVTSAIVGVRKRSHIEGALPAGDWVLDSQTKREVEAAMGARDSASVG